MLAKLPKKWLLVIGTFVRNDGLVNESQALELIGKLIREGRMEQGMTKLRFVAKAGIDYKTLTSMEAGARKPQFTNQRKVEHALGWREGIITDVLEHAAEYTEWSITLDFMREGQGEATWQDLDREESSLVRPVTRAGELSNEEILGELAYRLYNGTVRRGPKIDH
jgi:transcriptional regulator with XRE-family HTH domain